MPPKLAIVLELLTREVHSSRSPIMPHNKTCPFLRGRQLRRYYAEFQLQHEGEFLSMGYLCIVDDETRFLEEQYENEDVTTGNTVTSGQEDSAVDLSLCSNEDRRYSEIYCLEDFLASNPPLPPNTMAFVRTRLLVETEKEVG
ncbi:hypothetical protein B0J15DRAFT_473269 [Fusarium solani]|uniref:Uncharacterized protein n=1 Tax=Fusarium solani TaxID=169388 RepID=A0A9P9JRY0_FUSSL|nr:uncharacterized protein B0J15DRAFT_473269 [Fusarium solani]KAH7228642.1 hypothetical protein B0J15DRAFT_473269 [Fusarium solani]